MHYVIVGNGVAGTTAALRLRKRDPDSTVTLIGGESDYFFSRTGLMYAFMDKLTVRELEPYERKVYERQRITRLRDWVVDVDSQRRLVHLKRSGALRYDRLLLATGSSPNQPGWQGMGSVIEGVAHFVSAQDLEECERLTPSTRNAVVVGGGLIGVELVECLVHHAVQVDFLVREAWYWPIALSQSEGELIAAHLRSHGVRLRMEEQVATVEADAQGRVSAIRTDKEAVVPCERLGVCVGVHPAVDWLRAVATAPDIGRGILTDAGFQTSLPSVFAAGDCAEICFSDGSRKVEQIWYSAKRQGELAADAMLGDVVRYQPPLFYNSAKLFDLEFTTVGDARGEGDGQIAFCYHDPKKPVSIRLVEHHGRLAGFNGIGSRWNHNVIEEWIRNRVSMRTAVARLHEAQFDVEFGRYPLQPVREEFRQWLRGHAEPQQFAMGGTR